jgi:hypothetical protein
MAAAQRRLQSFPEIATTCDACQLPINLVQSQFRHTRIIVGHNSLKAHMLVPLLCPAAYSSSI